MNQNTSSARSSKRGLRDTEPRGFEEGGVGLGRSNNPDARDQCYLGNLYAESTVYEYAVKAYKRAITLDPKYATAHYKLGAVYYKTGLFDEAIEELQVAINLWSDLPLFHYTLGLVLKDYKRLDEAIESFTKAISLDQNYIKAYYRRGYAHFWKGDLREACSDLETVVKLDPGFGDALYNLGVTYISLNKWDLAQKVLLKYLNIKPSDADAYYCMGLVNAGSGEDSDQAIDSFQKAVELDSAHLDARFQLSLLHARKRYRKPSHRAKAIENLRILVEMYNELGDFDRINDALFVLGSVYDDEPEDADLAIEAYKTGLRLGKPSAEVHNNLGVLYSQKNEIDEAVSHLREAIHIDPDYESPYRNLAKIYFYQKNENIVRDFQTWIEEYPDVSAKILFNLSLALIDVGRAEACESIYSRAHRIKNLIGVAGSKLRRICRKLDINIRENFVPVLEDQEKSYNEMVSLLATLQQEDLVLDIVDVNDTILSVLRQADFSSDEKPECGILHLGVSESYDVKCYLDLDENLPHVNGDPGRLKEVFNNIIINSLDAMKNGGTLEIRTFYSEDSSKIEIIFKDTGTGISQDNLGNIFKPGFTTKETGSGFGLSIVDRIIKEHKGSVEILSETGEGTQVSIYLPVNLESEPIQTSLRMRPVIYEDPNELIFTEVDKIVGI